MLHDSPNSTPRLKTVRPPLDPILRRRLHGPIRSMDEPPMLTRILRFLRTR